MKDRATPPGPFIFRASDAGTQNHVCFSLCQRRDGFKYFETQSSAGRQRGTADKGPLK
jgi:hypothetical protein